MISLRLSKGLRQPPLETRGLEYSNEVTIPQLAVALSASVSRMGCRVIVRRVTDSKQYWSKSMGRTFVICTLPGTGADGSSASAPMQIGGGLVIDPNFKDQFSTPQMTQRYRCDIFSDSLVKIVQYTP